MSGKRFFRLVNKEVRRRAADYVLHEAPEGHFMEVSEPTRTLEQNSRMWPMLREIAKQVPVYGGIRMTEEDYKDLFTGSLKHINFVPAYGAPGRMVGLGQSTSQMTKSEFSDLFILMEQFAAEHGIVFSWEREVTA
ncbi:recombination protein NinB [Saezia sanguinis]|uniref:recombination protein NinB n=1 Tax=Saezia sanguinis TaxID=1965230 RepID=UPI003067442F